jgi:DNA-binding response OmpR family regulator
MRNKGYILLAEDEQLIQESNKRILERRGYSIRQAFNLTQARKIIADEMPRAIVLDIQFPDGNGLDFLNELRETSNIPILMLTAMGTPEDIVKGLEFGGDDYLAKPYELSVFLMRVEALLRRATMIPDKLIFDSITIDNVSGRAYIDDVDMCLQVKESLLLKLFIQCPDKLIRSETLYEKVWGQQMQGDENSLRKTMSRLRTKLDGTGYTIVVSRGEGYIFERV